MTTGFPPGQRVRFTALFDLPNIPGMRATPGCLGVVSARRRVKQALCYCLDLPWLSYSDSVVQTWWVPGSVLAAEV